MTENQNPETLEPGVIFEHSHYPSDELCAEIIDVAWRLGWRGRDRDDEALIRNAMHAAGCGDPDPDPDAVLPDPPRGFDPDDEIAVRENLTWAGDDAESWLSEHFAPEGHWIGNDGERGAFGVWPQDCEYCESGVSEYIVHGPWAWNPAAGRVEGPREYVCAACADDEIRAVGAEVTPLT